MNFLLSNPTLRILLSGSALVHLSSAMLGPIYALFVKDIGGSLLDASAAGTTYAISAGIIILLFGKLSDNVRQPKYILMAGYIILGCGFLLYTTVSSMLTLLLVQIVVGFGEALYSPAFDKLYSEHLDKGKSGTEWGFWEAMYYFTTALGAFLGGFLVYYYGFTVLFVTMAMLCFCSATYIHFASKKILT